MDMGTPEPLRQNLIKTIFISSQSISRTFTNDTKTENKISSCLKNCGMMPTVSFQLIANGPGTPEGIGSLVSVSVTTGK